jgi:choline dehydrogenase-like flavoprotein
LILATGWKNFSELSKRGKKGTQMSLKEKYDVIIVGSGTAGGTLVQQLSQSRPDLHILLIEKGVRIKPEENGKFWPFVLKHYRNFVIGSRSQEGVVIYAAEALGGTSVVSCGNLVRSARLEEKFAKLGVDLILSLAEAENLLKVKPLLTSRILGGSATIMQAANILGYPMAPMPKGVAKQCNSCGNCVLSCGAEAKWDVRPGIEASLQGDMVDLLPSTKVRRVIFSEQEVKGVELRSGKTISARNVVLCAGGLGTPVILQNSGIEAGEGLTIHPFVVTYGWLPNGHTQQKGMTMSAYYKPEEGIMLSPFLDHWSQKLLACGLFWSLRYPLSQVLGIMVKVADPESTGKVNANGRVNYSIPFEAQHRLESGAAKAGEVLLAAGVEQSTLNTTFRFPRGAHPSGTARLGEVVDVNLEVSNRKGLFISDASVIPLATGTPPILTLVAINIRLAMHLSNNL